jgi:ankyrin repeat protein
MQADERDDKEIVKILLDNGAKLDTIVGDQTPLSIAKQEGNPKIIALLDSHIPS